MTSDGRYTPLSGTAAKWLLMVYMQAGDNSNLDSLAVQDLKELQAGVQGLRDLTDDAEPDVKQAGDSGNLESLAVQGLTELKDPTDDGNPDVIVLVQMRRRWPDVPQRYLIQKGQPVRTLEQATDDHMATAASLYAFLSEALEMGGDTIDHHCLVLWGHNYGLGFGRDHGDPLKVKELAVALKKYETKRKARLDLLATNSCTMAYAEAAFELKDAAKYLVASQVYMPLAGFPYFPILRSIHSKTSPFDLGLTFVDEYFNSFTASPNREKVAMSLLNLGQAESLKELLEKTANAIQAVLKRGGGRIVEQTVREMQDVFLANPAGDVRPVLDLKNLAQDLKDYCDDSQPQSVEHSKAAPGFGEALDALRGLGDDIIKICDLPKDPKNDEAEKASRLVLARRESPDLGPLGGIGVFAPFVVDKVARTQLELSSKADKKTYTEFEIFQGASRWPGLVYDTLRREEPDEIIDSAGFVRPVELVAVNQMTAAVEATFNIFDRVLTANKKSLLGLLGDRISGKTDDLLPFGPPKLMLAGDLTLQSPVGGSPQAHAPRKIVLAFARIERAARLVETTIQSVMTNGSFGLGPPAKAQGFGPKSAGGYGPKSAGGYGPKSAGGYGPKSAGGYGPKWAGGYGPKSAGGYGPKSAGGYGPKSAGGYGPDLSTEVGAITAFLSSDAQVAILSVTVMFRALAAGLSSLEEALSNIELAAADCLQPGFGSLLPTDDDYRLAMRQNFDRLFSMAADAALVVRQTAREVMQHPVYGLGSGPEGFGQPERNELAIIAGLAGGQLLLLQKPVPS